MAAQIGNPDDRQPTAKSQAWDSPGIASDGMALLDHGGHILEIDTEALRLLECDLSSVTGRDFWDLVPEEVADQYQLATDKAMASSTRHAFVAHHKFKDSWIEYTFRRQSNGYTVSLRNVASTQKLQQMLRESERYNQLIFEVNPNAMWIFDAESLRILSVNRAAVEFYGIPRQSFLKLRLGALFPDGEGISLLSSLKPEKGASHAVLRPQICKQKKRDGQLVLVELACGRISWNEQQAVLVSLADVTDRHLADRALRRENAEFEEEVARLNGELKTTSRDLAAFTYALSNDLQGPLHAVNGFASMLTDKYSGVLDDAGRHYINRIQASTRQLAKLVADLRILVQLPKLSGDLEKIDLDGMAATLIDDLRKRDPARLVTVEMDISVTLWADKGLLVTALSCLLENAWKFTSRKADGWIRIGLQPGDNPDELVLQVSDNGNGFDPNYSDRLFIAFQRLHSSADFPGNGLGLAIVRRVAETHGGRVWAQTSATGASFFMAFPQGQVDLP
ncbi:MAG: ATP-binding protein [Polaromonas sp.]